MMVSFDPLKEYDVGLIPLEDHARCGTCLMHGETGIGSV